MYMMFSERKSDDSIKKFWGRMSEMITGPEHEYTYLKKIIARYDKKYEN